MKYRVIAEAKSGKDYYVEADCITVREGEEYIEGMIPSSGYVAKYKDRDRQEVILFAIVAKYYVMGVGRDGIQKETMIHPMVMDGDGYIHAADDDRDFDCIEKGQE